VIKKCRTCGVLVELTPYKMMKGLRNENKYLQKEKDFALADKQDEIDRYDRLREKFDKLYETQLRWKTSRMSLEKQLQAATQKADRYREALRAISKLPCFHCGKAEQALEALQSNEGEGE